MKRFQFTIQALLALTVLVAVGCTAMINASPVWSSGILGAVLVVLTVALLRALMLGREAPFCIGLAAAGWVYFLLALSPLASYELRAQLPTQVALVHLAGRKYEVPVDERSGRWYLGRLSYFPRAYSVPPAEEEINAAAFCEIGHELITLVFGFCGGVFCFYIGALKQRRDGRSP